MCRLQMYFTVFNAGLLASKVHNHRSFSCKQVIVANVNSLALTSGSHHYLGGTPDSRYSVLVTVASCTDQNRDMCIQSRLVRPRLMICYKECWTDADESLAFHAIFLCLLDSDHIIYSQDGDGSFSGKLQEQKIISAKTAHVTLAAMHIAVH